MNATVVRKRVRLAPAQRCELILDAALTEFSTHGYAAARIEDIAHRAGLSKAGVYAHYASKDAIFEALLNKLLRSPAAEEPPGELRDQAGLEAAVDRFLDRAYARLRDPVVAAIFRLLISEGSRVPQLVRAWRSGMLWPHLQAHEPLLARLADAGGIGERIELAYSPVLHALMQHLMFGDGLDEAATAPTRRAHRHLLLVLLGEAARRQAPGKRSAGADRPGGGRAGDGLR
jgi:AcrR family transcriptional regulator